MPLPTAQSIADKIAENAVRNLRSDIARAIALAQSQHAIDGGEGPALKCEHGAPKNEDVLKELTDLGYAASHKNGKYTIDWSAPAPAVPGVVAYFPAATYTKSIATASGYDYALLQVNRAIKRAEHEPESKFPLSVVAPESAQMITELQAAGFSVSYADGKYTIELPAPTPK